MVGGQRINNMLQPYSMESVWSSGCDYKDFHFNFVANLYVFIQIESFGLKKFIRK